MFHYIVKTSVCGTKFNHGKEFARSWTFPADQCYYRKRERRLRIARATAITVINLKGGVGKTHTVWLLAGVCQERGKKLLVIDTDTQGNITKSLLPPAWSSHPRRGSAFRSADGHPSRESHTPHALQPRRFAALESPAWRPTTFPTRRSGSNPTCICRLRKGSAQLKTATITSSSTARRDCRW